jgi:hypothetical protein
MKERQMIVELTSSEVSKFMAPAGEGGGFQHFLAKLQSRIVDNQLELSDDEIERIERYSYDYGEGGWEGQLRVLLQAIERSH